MRVRIFRYILLLIFIIGIIVYNILVQKDIIDFDKTIYSVVYIYIAVFVIWFIIELTIFNSKSIKGANIRNNKSTKIPSKEMPTLKKDSNPQYKTAFGDDTISRIAKGFNDKKKDVKYCSNCHREIYSSNYTGTNLCTECKKHYYD